MCRAYLDEEIWIGDYVLTGGELAATVMIDAIIRLRPGVLGNEASIQDDSFAEALLGAPQYTRPQEFQGRLVPDVLLSGNHQQIRRWRRREALRCTLQRRPDLLQGAVLSREDRTLLQEIQPLTPSHGAGPEGYPMNILQLFEEDGRKSDIPSFQAGDSVRVHVRVVEGEKERIQMFEGVVIARKGGSNRETFTVRKISYGIGVERIFPLHSPMIEKIDVVRLGRVRRAKLYYLRSKKGRAARIRERRPS